MNKKTYYGFLALLVVVVGVLASQWYLRQQKEPIGIRGSIIGIDEDDAGNVTSILVEGAVEEDTMYDKATVKIDSNTKFYLGNDRSTAEALELGVRVEVVFEGEVAESYPVQGTAKSIRILP